MLKCRDRVGKDFCALALRSDIDTNHIALWVVWILFSCDSFNPLRVQSCDKSVCCLFYGFICTGVRPYHYTNLSSQHL